MLTRLSAGINRTALKSIVSPSGNMRLCARKEPVLKPCRQVAFLLGAWTAIPLSLCVACFAFRTFYLEPDNPRISMTVNWLERIGITVAALIFLLLLWFFADYCILKRRELRRH
jgi:hypothetical protein